MAILIDERVVQLELSDLLKRKVLIKPAAPVPRSPGVHLSGVLHPLGKAIGKCKYADKFEDEYPLIMGLGNAWEEYICSFYPDMDWQPGELQVDGIWMTCDGITAFPWFREPAVRPMSRVHDSLLEECKFTFRAVRTGEEWLDTDDNWYWLHQARAYCYGYGPRLVRWHVCHVRGDYKTFGPVYKQYVVEFTDRECEQTMRMVKRHEHMAVPEAV